MFHQQVYVLVHGHRKVLAEGVLHHDVIAVRRPQVERRGHFIRGVRQELFIRAEDHKPHRRTRIRAQPLHLHEERAHLLEVPRHLASAMLARGGEQLEVWGFDFQPTRCVAPCGGKHDHGANEGG